MTPDDYERFTARLVDGLGRDPRVTGLVALGSMAATGHRPDRFSDHDFFVIVPEGEAEGLRRELSWLPDAADVVLSFRETAHGLKALYGSGHLVEFAVFEPDEIRLARVNAYRVLLDRTDVTGRMEAVHRATVASRAADPPADAVLLGQLLTALLVGAGRYARGERLAGTAIVTERALRNLLVLLARHVPAQEPSALDDLDPFRRVERAWPALGAELDAAVAHPAPAAGRRLVEIAVRELGPRIDRFPFEAAATVSRLLSEWATPTP